MNYATGYALNIHDIFSNFDCSKLKLTSKECEKLIGNRHRENIAKDIFKSAIKLVLDDIINNNVTFLLPTRSKKAELYMKRFNKDQFSKARRYGKWSDVDFLSSNFSSYQMSFKFQSAGVIREKLVYLDPVNKKKITNNTNNGKQYY